MVDIIACNRVTCALQSAEAIDEGLMRRHRLEAAEAGLDADVADVLRGPVVQPPDALAPIVDSGDKGFRQRRDLGVGPGGALVLGPNHGGDIAPARESADLVVGRHVVEVRRVGERFRLHARKYDGADRPAALRLDRLLRADGPGLQGEAFGCVDDDPAAFYRLRDVENVVARKAVAELGLAHVPCHTAMHDVAGFDVGKNDDLDPLVVEKRLGQRRIGGAVEDGDGIDGECAAVRLHSRQIVERYGLVGAVVVELALDEPLAPSPVSAL